MSAIRGLHYKFKKLFLIEQRNREFNEFKDFRDIKVFLLYSLNSLNSLIFIAKEAKPCQTARPIFRQSSAKILIATTGPSPPYQRGI